MARGARERRVVVTGLGCVSPLGADTESTWQALLEGRSGVGPITRFDTAPFPVEIAAEFDGEPDLSSVPPKEARRLDRSIGFAVQATAEAVAASGLEIDERNRDRIGVAIGSGIGGLESLQEAYRALFSSGPRRVSPFALPMTLANLSAGYVAIQQGARGPNLCHVAACAASAQSIGEAVWVIERGSADAMLVGGVEAAVTEIGLACFSAMRALSTRNDEPLAASRPFDQDRDGFVIGEGGAALVLEAFDHARARGAPVLAEVLGYGMSADAANVAAPTDDGEGSQRCMRLALADAGLDPSDVGYLNAHATSTPAGDVSEARAIRAVFGGHAERLPVSSTKGATGHLLGAAGALEALFCIRALQTGVLPPTLNLERPDPECELDHVAHKPRPASISVAASNSFGFGGTNATLLLAHPDR